MHNFAITLGLFIIGAVLGSFGCCQVWRIKKKDKSKWSHCMHCGYVLRPIDNIPIVSWLMLGGRCRKCRKPIGYAEILGEVAMGIAFALSYLLWPEIALLKDLQYVEIIKFALFLILLVIYEIIFIYDAKWKEIPTKMLYSAIGVSAVYLILSVCDAYILGNDFNYLSLVGGLVVFPGFYYLMYKISRESWVGEGDWYVCLAMALVLADFWLSLGALFVSNIVGCLVMLPVTLALRKTKLKIPFGPFLIIGFLIVFFAQNFILSFVSF